MIKRVQGIHRLAQAHSRKLFPEHQALIYPFLWTNRRAFWEELVITLHFFLCFGGFETPIRAVPSPSELKASDGSLSRGGGLHRWSSTRKRWRSCRRRRSMSPRSGRWTSTARPPLKPQLTPLRRDRPPSSPQPFPTPGPPPRQSMLRKGQKLKPNWAQIFLLFMLGNELWIQTASLQQQHRI